MGIESRSEGLEPPWCAYSTRPSNGPMSTCSITVETRGVMTSRFRVRVIRPNSKFWCPLQESNPRPPAYKAGALPTELKGLAGTNYTA